MQLLGKGISVRVSQSPQGGLRMGSNITTGILTSLTTRHSLYVSLGRNFRLLLFEEQGHHLGKTLLVFLSVRLNLHHCFVDLMSREITLCGPESVAS